MAQFLRNISQRRKARKERDEIVSPLRSLRLSERKDPQTEPVPEFGRIWRTVWGGAETPREDLVHFVDEPVFDYVVNELSGCFETHFIEYPRPVRVNGGKTER